MLTRAQLQRLVDRVLLLAAPRKGAEAIVSIRSSRGGNTRFAVNAITSSGDIESLSLSVIVKIGQRAASATTNQLDDRAIEDVVSRAQRLARLSPENPEAMPILGPQKHPQLKGAHDPATADHSATARAKAVGAVIAAGDQAKVQIAGFYEHGAHTWALATSAGLSAFHAWTSCGLSCTARTPDGTGSGWAGSHGHRVADLDAGALARVAIAKAVASARPKKLEPGRYTVVLEPEAVADMLAYLPGAFDARRADEGRSVFAKPGGGNRLGEKLFPELVTVRTDPADVALTAAPFDGEGVPQERRAWIDKGVLSGLTYGRFWAHKQGKRPTGWPEGWSLDGGKATRDELIKGVKRGVLITRFWYIRSLDPQSLLLTGLTRDGTFRIEDGAIAGPVNNFRFNESPVQMLARCDALGTAVVTGGWRVPALRTHEFNLASISEAV